MAGRASALPLHVGAADASSLDPTSVGVSPASPTISPGTSVKLTAFVTDASATPTVPGGTITWSDGGAAGNFSAPSCSLSRLSASQSSCSVSYLDHAQVGSTVTIVGAYPGDATHAPGASSAALTVVALSTAVVSPSPSSVISGQVVNYTVTVTDASNGPASAPTGEVAWSDNGAGGYFAASICSLVATSNFTSDCTVTYSAPDVAAAAIQVQLSAAYPGDSLHGAVTVPVSLTVLPTTVEVTVSYSAFGKGVVIPPTFTFGVSNGTETVTLTTTPTSYAVDVNSPWFVSSQLGNSTSTDAWNLRGPSQGTTQYVFSAPDGQSLMSFAYYHQYSVDLGYKIVGGTSGASIPPFVTYTSFGVKLDVGAPGQTWADVGTAYAYPALLPGSIGDSRWIAQGVNGTMTGPGNLSPTYYHQYYLSVSFGVQDSTVAQTAPTFFAQSMGSPFNVSLASLSSKLWLDAGAKYSFTDPLAGGNSSVRWSAGSSSSGIVGDADIAVTYYMQYPVLASFKTSDGSTPGAPTGNRVSPSFATLDGVQGDENVTIQLSTQPQEVWLDSGTPYSIPNVLLALPTQRWVATGVVSGTVAPGVNLTQTYFHEYLLNVSYFASGPPTAAPMLTYTELGNQTQSPLVAHNPLFANSTSFWADAGTRFFVADSLPGDRWYAPGAAGGVASSNMTVMYFHQYQVQVSLQVTSGAVPAQVSISGTSGGQPFSQLLGPTPVGVWLDSGTNYTVPQTLLQLPTERWVAASELAGVASAPSNVTQVYFHQALLNVSASNAPSSSPPTMDYVSMGQLTQATLSQNGSALWADVGTSFTLQNDISGITGDRWYSPLAGGNVTGPVQESARFYHQYLLTYVFDPIGGNMTPPPAMAVLQAGGAGSVVLSNQTVRAWVDAGSHWSLSTLANQQGERWVTSSPTQGTASAPATVRLSFVLQFLVTTAPVPASGGSVTAGGWYNASSDIAIQATPGQGWALGAWTGVGTSSYSGTSSTLSISVLSPVNETAQFEPSLTIISSNGGSVKYTTGPSVQSIGAGRSAQTYVAANGTVTLQAKASFPYQFVKWSGVDANSSDPLSLSVRAPTTIQAVFAPSYVDLVGLPGLVLASGLSMYLGRHFVLASGRQVMRNLRLRKKEAAD